MCTHNTIPTPIPNLIRLPFPHHKPCRHDAARGREYPILQINSNIADGAATVLDGRLELSRDKRVVKHCDDFRE